jgi:hypothetical protein
MPWNQQMGDSGLESRLLQECGKRDGLQMQVLYVETVQFMFIHWKCSHKFANWGLRGTTGSFQDSCVNIRSHRHNRTHGNMSGSIRGYLGQVGQFWSSHALMGNLIIENWLLRAICVVANMAKKMSHQVRIMACCGLVQLFDPPVSQCKDTPFP